MEVSAVQIITTVVLIVTAAGLALFCDFLKAKNDQLREAMVELRLRREQDALRAATIERKPPAAVPLAPPVVQRSEPVRAPAVPAERVAPSPMRKRVPVAADTFVRKSSPAPQTQRPKPDIAATQPVSKREPKLAAKMDDANSKDALADWLNRRAAARAARVALRTEPAAPKPEPQRTAPAVPVAKPVEIEKKPEPVQETAPISSRPAAAVKVDSFLWESLLSGKASKAPPPVDPQKQDTKPAAVQQKQFELIRGAAETSMHLVVPGGMFGQEYLARLVEIKKPFTGLVVSIGVTENDGRTPQTEDLMRSASNYVAGLLREGDFGCQTAADEFLMICPGEQGADAQRRLSNISERLWDFQLRGIGAFTVLFSWGGIDVRNEPLSDAIASATERMYQTKRTRKTVSMDSVNQRRKVV